MSEDQVDLIVVGAGPAGSTAALVAARAGLDTLLIERGNFAGAKNMTGGRLYAHSLEKLLPGFAEEAPVERVVTRERISMLNETDAVTVEYAAPRSQVAASRSYTVLRTSFDQWLCSKAEEAGAQLVPGVRVDELLVRDGKVCGVRAGDETLEARAVILADGVNSLLGTQLGMVRAVNTHTCAVGVKEVLEFTPQQMADRFACTGNEGTAWLFAGMPSGGYMGGGFLYTNASSVSLGVVFGLHNMDKVGKSVPQMLEDFRSHPAVAPLLEGGKLVEYSAHVVPEGGYAMVPDLVRDGVLLAGDAAGLCLNVGYTVRGMDLAIASGEAAAQAVIAAKQHDDFSAAGFGGYRQALEDSFVLKDLKLYRNLPHTLDNNRIFSAYPDMAAGIMADMFNVNGPSAPLRNKLWGRAKNVGLLNLLKDGINVMRSL
ncbi:FAD-dependent oxidoreductase [Desulfovibrio desulfuricans]|uniref:FAD-dependent oxidoreductase n=1 Tax=Desulfovibrio desulfuricans TaxID=876 RepID=A0A4P7ULV7_DESDE|nr:FAD-dependent oxidoreductase [Desulfovibrio desulfuricans]QCC85671.1 FAD-dependent oxidoreductase [Desulfovibrio desulfuricans]